MQKINSVSFLAVFALIFSFTMSGCSPIEALLEEIRQAGYIPFQNPMEFSGTGTLVGAVGGKASKLTFVAPPETCFPEKLPDGTPTDLRVRDTTALPSQNRVVTVGFDVNVAVLQGLSSANGSLAAGASFNSVEKMEVSFEGAHIDYMDSVKLVKFYQQQMNPDCKPWLEKTGFIVQALEADKLSFKLYSKEGGSIKLTMDNLKSFIDISADLAFEIDNDVELVITTPKFLGYQLGKFQKIDNGSAYYRAASTRLDDTFDWQSIALFGDEDHDADNSADLGSSGLTVIPVSEEIRVF